MRDLNGPSLVLSQSLSAGTTYTPWQDMMGLSSFSDQITCGSGVSVVATVEVCNARDGDVKNPIAFTDTPSLSVAASTTDGTGAIDLEYRWARTKLVVTGTGQVDVLRAVKGGN